MSVPTVILLDVSQSMDTPVRNNQRRIDLLSDILRNVVTPQMQLIAFNHAVVSLEPGEPVPEPEGSTALHLALDHALRASPKRVIVVSDGHPDDPDAAIASACALNCVISTFYCGEETDRHAVSFMKRLALCSRGGVGRPQIADLRSPELAAGKLRLLLAGPSP